MRSKLAVAALVSGLAIPSALHAQDALPDDVLRRPTRSLSFEWGGGLVGLGYWTRLSDAADLGIEGGFSVSRQTDANDETSTSYSVSLSPALKRHLKGSGELAPYVLIGPTGSWSRSSQSGGNVSTGLSAGAKAGFGLEWFPMSSVSVGAQLGVSAGYARSRRETGVGVVQTTNGLFIRTQHSGLRLHLYF